MNNTIKYCALTTVSNSLKSFMLPSLYYFKERGFDITVSCAKDLMFAEMVKNDFTYYPLDIERGFNLKKTIFNIYNLWLYFRKNKFDIVEYGTENVSFCAAIASYLANVPIRIYDHWGARYVGLSGISRYLSIIIEYCAALFSTDIRQVSFMNADMCVKKGLYPASKVKVLGKGGTIGVDFSDFDLNKKSVLADMVKKEFNIPQRAFIYGFVGRIQVDKGINELLNAFKKLAERYDDIYLLLVGELDGNINIDKTLLKWAMCHKKVIFTGFKNDVYKYMSTFDILVHPTYREGFGMVLQEAAALKIPIITTDIIGPGEFIQNGVTGLLVKSHSSTELQEAMLLLKEDEEKRSLFVDKNYIYTKQYFSRPIMIERLFLDRIELLKKSI